MRPIVPSSENVYRAHVACSSHFYASETPGAYALVTAVSELYWFVRSVENAELLPLPFRARTS